MLRAVGKSMPIIGLCWALSGCAGNGAEHRPLVDNYDLHNYEADLLSCQQLAKSYSDSELLQGGMLGALGGALVGLGEGREETLAGAAIGAVVGATGGALLANKERRKILVQCMRDKGYNVQD